ncbi:MAG: hypothetical protein J6H18_00400 [Lachnospiraceae bacterium]|nr:hypothetical protein [Lachnospiraceae bacterium]
MKKRVLGLILILCLILGACGGRNEFALRANELLAVGDKVCSWSEAQMHILSQHSRYAPVYGEDIWKVSLAEGDLETYIRDGLLDYLKLLFLADYGAERAGISLSNAEMSAVSRAAASYMQALGEEGRRRTGITEEIALEAFSRYARGQVFYRQTMIDGQIEVSDEEARVISVEIIEIENRVGLGKTREIQSELAEGKAATEVIRGIDGVSGRRELVTRGSYPQDWETIVFALKQGQWSPLISGDTVSFLVLSLSPFVVEETARHKAEMEREAREKNLMDRMKALAESSQLIYNPALWDSWNMAQYADFAPVNFFDFTGELEK